MKTDQYVPNIRQHRKYLPYRTPNKTKTFFNLCNNRIRIMTKILQEKGPCIQEKKEKSIELKQS